MKGNRLKAKTLAFGINNKKIKSGIDLLYAWFSWPDICIWLFPLKFYIILYFLENNKIANTPRNDNAQLKEIGVVKIYTKKKKLELDLQAQYNSEVRFQNKSNGVNFEHTNNEL